MNQALKTGWLIVGGGPAAPAYFDAAMRFPLSSITTNCGWQLWATQCHETGGYGDAQVPDYYWLSDGVACELFGRAARWVKHHGGRIITMKRSDAGLALRGLDGLADEKIDLPQRAGGCPRFEPGRFIHPRFSGLICLQYAVNHAAPGGVVVCLGMEGYRSTSVELQRDTFDGRMGKPKGHAHTQDWIAPFTRSVVEARPDLQFIFAGKLRYALEADNVRLVREVDELIEAIGAAQQAREAVCYG